MPLDTLTTSLAPQRGGLVLEETQRVLNANFGDGYEQSTPDGINAVRGSITVTWPPLPITECDTIMTFFRSHNGQPFYWTLPNEGTPRIWRVDGAPRREYGIAPNYDRISAKLVERFDP